MGPFQTLAPLQRPMKRGVLVSDVRPCRFQQPPARMTGVVCTLGRRRSRACTEALPRCVRAQPYWLSRCQSDGGWGLSVKRIAIAADGSRQVEDLEALTAWFDEEPELRGLIKPAAGMPDAGELGTLPDALLAAVGGGGAVSVLAASLKAFFSQPRGPKVHLTVTRGDGTRLELDADRVARGSVPELARQLLAADVVES